MIRNTAAAIALVAIGFAAGAAGIASAESSTAPSSRVVYMQDKSPRAQRHIIAIERKTAKKYGMPAGMTFYGPAIGRPSPKVFCFGFENLTGRSIRVTHRTEHVDVGHFAPGELAGLCSDGSGSDYLDADGS